MPPASKTAHRVISNTAIPYISNSSVTSTDPQFIGGSTNIMTSLRQWMENRPGFSTEFDTTSFTNVQRNFLWRRWSGVSPNAGAFIWMVCDISGGKSNVYKKILGVDSAPVLLFSSNSHEPFDFVVSNNTCYMGNGLNMKKFDSQTLSNWGIASPTADIGLSLTSGAMNVYTSWCYCYTYYNSVTDHESSPSEISACSGVFTNKTVQLSLVQSGDPQITNMRVYRTPDGGAPDPTLMQEIQGSPFPNVTGTYNDTTLDINLSIRTAPAFLRNDPPTPCKGFVTYGGRIWGLQNNVSYYSGLEEISNGVPEECWPSGLDGNNYPWATEVNAHAALIDGIAVFEAERISKIEGDSLDTFRKYTLLEKRGTRSRTTVASLGGSVVWLDTSNTIWLSDIGEIGIPIRPDTQNFDPATCWIALHISGLFHWVTVLDGTAGLLYVYDLDLKQWMPPWTVGVSSALFSGETDIGDVNLLIARNRTKVLQLTPGSYNDDGSVYGSICKTNMYALTPDGNPSFQGVHDWSEIKTDQIRPSQVFQLTDDDPGFGTYTDLTANGEPSPLIIKGKYLQSWRYPSNNPTADFLSMKYVWSGGTNFHVYQIDMSFHSSGG